MLNNVQKIICEICDEKKINCKLVSKDWIFVLQKNNKVEFIVGYKFPLNNQCSGKICDDKFAMYDVLKEFNIPIVEHFIVFNNYNREKIIEYCKKYNFNMVLKNNVGTCGNDMFHVENENDLFEKLDELLSKNYSVSLNPYYDIKTEYRIIILDNNAELVYGKKKPIVIGNGKKTIYELLCEFNPNYFITNDKAKKLTKILDKGEIFEYNWQFNLSKGAMPFLIKDQSKTKMLVERAKQITEILGVGFASVDLVELNDGSILLLEVNSGVMMENISKNFPNGKQIAKRIYAKVIDKMFE